MPKQKIRFQKVRDVDMPEEGVIDAKKVILKQIDESPGIRHRKLVRVTGLNNGVPGYHLKILEKTQKVKVNRSDGKRTGYCSIDRHRWSTQLAIRSIAGAIILLLLSSTFMTSLVSGEVFPKSQAAAPIGSNKSISTLSLTKQPTAHNVKITSPTKGEKVPVGKNLVISGTSAGN